MKAPPAIQLIRFGLNAAVALFSLPAQANPISFPERSVTPEVTFLIAVSISIEAGCVWLMLRRFRQPRLFVLWLIGMHVITYPTFLGILWLLQTMRPALTVAFGEIAAVLIEGAIIYLICSRAPSAPNLPLPSLVRCTMASLAGNICSLVAFPFLMTLYHLR